MLQFCTDIDLRHLTVWLLGFEVQQHATGRLHALESLYRIGPGCYFSKAIGLKNVIESCWMCQVCQV